MIEKFKKSNLGFNGNDFKKLHLHGIISIPKQKSFLSSTLKRPPLCGGSFPFFWWGALLALLGEQKSIGRARTPARRPEGEGARTSDPTEQQTNETANKKRDNKTRKEKDERKTRGRNGPRPAGAAIPRTALNIGLAATANSS